MEPGLAQLSRHLGYSFNDATLLTRALSHRSVGADNNERLEFLGDSVLNLIITESLYSRFPNAREGQLSQMRARLVKGKTLAAVARGFGLGEHLLLGSGELKSGGHRRESILADALEAIIGAIYLDTGMESARRTVLAWFSERLDTIKPSEHANKDAKTQLQELLQADRKPLPTYSIVNTTGSEHQQTFEVACLIDQCEQPFIGRGSSRRSAEQSAARLALESLNQPRH